MFEFEFSSSGGGTAWGVQPTTYIPTIKHHMTMGYSGGGGYINGYLGRETNGEDYFIALSSPPFNTYYKVKITKEDDTIKYYFNDELKKTYTGKTYLANEQRTFIMGDWKANVTAKAKNIKIKEL